MRPRFIRGVRVRELAREQGKLASRGYLAWLDLKVEQLVRAHASSMGSRRILRAEDAELRGRVNAAVQGARRGGVR